MALAEVLRDVGRSPATIQDADHPTKLERRIREAVNTLGHWDPRLPNKHSL